MKCGSAVYNGIVVLWVLMLVVNRSRKKGDDGVDGHSEGGDGGSIEAPVASPTNNIEPIPLLPSPQQTEGRQQKVPGFKRVAPVRGSLFSASTVDGKLGIPVPSPRFDIDYMVQPYFREDIQGLGNCVSTPVEEFVVNTFFSQDTPDVSSRRMFLDIGPCDWDQSNSDYLQNAKGWRGILVEPSPNTAMSLSRKRATKRVTVIHSPVCHKSRGTVTYKVPTDGGCGVVQEFATSTALFIFRSAQDKSMKCVHMDDLRIENSSLIDYLSIQTSGAEWDVLRDYDFNARPVAVLSLGYSKQRKQILERLKSQGFVLVQVVGHVDILFHPKHISLHPNSPHNVLMAK
jgi:hypothetical protein